MKIIKITLLLVLLHISCSLKAGEFCVNDTFELRSALTIADNNNAHDVIKIAEGNYITNGVAFSYNDLNGKDLEISGGWSPVLNNPCGQQLGGNPYGTILDGDNSSNILNIETKSVANVVVSGIAFINGLDATGFGAGLKIMNNSATASEQFFIENNVFINNESVWASALYLNGADEVIVRNNLFFSNIVTDGNVTTIFMNNGYGLYFTNNTMILNNAENESGSGIHLSVNGTSQALVANNVLKDNLTFNIYLGGNGNIYLKNNDLGSLGGPNNPLENVGNINLPPRFESGLFNFFPSAISPLVNAGVKPCSICPFPVPFDESWGLGATDLMGYVRNQNGGVDIGAIESIHVPDLIFWGIFE